MEHYHHCGAHQTLSLSHIPPSSPFQYPALPLYFSMRSSFLSNSWNKFQVCAYNTNKSQFLEYANLLFPISILFQLQQNMKLVSPFVDFIPDCKRTMRRLRKKIYKFITSKNYIKKQQPPADLIRALSQAPLPSILQELLAKRKSSDLSAIRSLNVPKMSLKDIASITLNQEKMVTAMQQEWLENNRTKSKLKASLMEGLRDNFSKRTLSSTEFEYDQEEELCGDSSGQFMREESSLQNLNQDIDFHHFERGNSFLQIESSILSQENLFRFQQ